MRSRFKIVALVAAMAGLAGQAVAQDFDPMQFFDTDKNGKITLAEYTAGSEQGWGFFSQGADKVKVADLDPMMKGAFTGIATDADGTVTKAAYLGAMPARFKAADTNGDGTLDAKELTATMGPPPA